MVLRALVVALLLPLPALAAQEPLLERVRSVLPRLPASRVEHIAADAERDGVPSELVYRKALEGAAKGVPAERILPVLDEYADRLREARALLGPGREAATLAVTADAIRRGASPDAIRFVARENPGDIAIAVLVLGELAAAHVPVDHALEVVTWALQRGEGGERLLGYSAEVRRRIQLGEPPGRAADAVRRGLTDRGVTPPARDAQPRRRTRGAQAPAGPPVPPGSGPPSRARDRRGRAP